jgi:tRNA threonylcarbamoyl adenosine modification protein YjeE
VPGITRTSTSQEYTAAMARGLAALLRPGDVIALSGELGAGKTTFVRALAGALGIDQAMVSSPTFVMVNEYPIPPGTSPLSRGELIHIDAYRLSGTNDLEPLGWDRLFDAQGRAAGTSAAVIEWPENIAQALPQARAEVRLTATGEQTRELALTIPESWSGRTGSDWLIDREPRVCPVTGRWVPPTAATYPFADARARDADMYRWFTGGYKSSRAAGGGESQGDDA